MKKKIIIIKNRKQKGNRKRMDKNRNKKEDYNK